MNRTAQKFHFALGEMNAAAGPLPERGVTWPRKEDYKQVPQLEGRAANLKLNFIGPA
jgi:hypothetical protein